MAELDDKFKELSDIIENTKSSTAKMNEVARSTATTIDAINTSFTNVASTLNSLAQSITVTLTQQQLAPKFSKLGEQLAKYGDFVDLNQKQLMEVANILGEVKIASEIGKLKGLVDTEGNALMLGSGALTDFANALEQIRADKIKKLQESIQQSTASNEQQNEAQSKVVIEFNRLSNKFSQLNDKLNKFNKGINFSGAGALIVGELFMKAGTALTNLRDRIYRLQFELGTTFMSAITAGTSAIQNQIISFFSAGPVLSFQDTIDTINAFQKEFGGLLTTDAARRIAQESKELGVSAEVYLKAQRAFLVVGGDITRTAFVTQFRNAGLTAAQALQFAATNANLVAIAGVKYADALARAAANAQRVGVSLDKTEQFADNLVGDFEGALERFSELRAMGVEVDFSRLAQVAATGTPEEVFGELSKEMGGNRALLENIQKNRFLKVAIEKDLGLSIADVTRLAAGGAAKAPEATEAEKQRTLTTTLIERAGFLITGIGGLLSILTLNISALTANTAALLKNASISSLKELFTGGGAAGTLGKVGGVGLGLTGLGVGVGSAMFGRSLAEEGYTKTGIGVGAIGGALAGSLLATALAPFTAGASLAAIPYLASLGAIAGGTYSGMGGKAYGGLITGPGTATSDNIMTPTSPGEFVVNAKATDTYGTNFLNSVNKGTYQPQASAVSVDMSRVEAKLEILAKDTTVAKLVDAIGKIKINMSGYEVGNVALNDRSPLYTASPSQAV